LLKDGRTFGTCAHVEEHDGYSATVTRCGHTDLANAQSLPRGAAVLAVCSCRYVEDGVVNRVAFEEWLLGEREAPRAEIDSVVRGARPWRRYPLPAEQRMGGLGGVRRR
jgi:hypothetical protein